MGARLSIYKTWWGVWGRLSHFGDAQDGAIAVLFAVLLVPMLIGVGVSVDYIRAYNAHAEMQAELDAALIAAIKSIDKVNKNKLEKTVEEWFAAQTRVTEYKIDDITIDMTNSTITATAHGMVPTTFLVLAGLERVEVSVTSQIAGPATSFIDVFLVLDKSASMMLAATSIGQQTMRSAVGCEFACHNGDPHTVNGKDYPNNYAFSLEQGVRLRSDVLISAVDRVLTAVDEVDPSGNHIRVGLYRLSGDVQEVLAPTASSPKVSKTLHDPSNSLTSASSSSTTHFDVALTQLASIVGKNGSGKSASDPTKLVMLITDGVQSERPWVHGDTAKTSPLNPDWCGPAKKGGVTFATVYTSYLPMTADSGYMATVGNTMASSGYTSTWGGKMRAGTFGTMSRRDYLAIALEDCATSSSYFMQATEAGEIEGSLETLFQRFVKSVRLTK